MSGLWAELKDAGTTLEVPPAAGAGLDGSPSAPRTFDGAWNDARALAEAEAEPVFVPVTPHVDERGWSLMNLFVGALRADGQVNFSVQHPGVIKAWHRHQRQSDFWCCVGGHLKAGVHRESDGRTWLAVIGEQRPGVLIIPPPLWHGAECVGATPAALLYYVTRAYDHDAPDEQRRRFDGVEGFPWGVRHG